MNQEDLDSDQPIPQTPITPPPASAAPKVDREMEQFEAQKVNKIDEPAKAVNPSGDAEAAEAAETAETEEEEFLCEDAGTENSERMKQIIVGALKTVFDPEIPVDIYSLGMIYKIIVDEDNRSKVTMTLTSPSCPVAGSLPGEAEQKVKDAPGVSEAKVVLVWDPPWTPDMMSEAAKLQLNMM